MQTIHGRRIDEPGAVTLIDAHHHLWDLKRNRYPWLADKPEAHFFLGDYGALKRDYMPDDYRRDARGHNVLKTVHCEAEWDRDDQVGETVWLTEMNARFGLPTAIVAHAWFHAGNGPEVIARQAGFPLVRGIRSKPVTALAPDRMTPGAPGTMQDPRWLEGFALLERYGLSWDLRVPSWHLHEAAAVARAFPRTRIVLNHTGFPWDRSAEGLAAWRKAMQAVAACPNVHLKVSELGLKDQPWDYESNRRIVRDAIAIFGIARCMFATNFPVAGLRIGYDALVRAVQRMLADLPAADQERFFWRNAESFYRL
ncbi:MAG: amidohydrolase family protein [Alphaproteobacteria bacterium]|nr:amidohydrolase family protein [Alphaproteobacteria bacterium]